MFVDPATGQVCQDFMPYVQKLQQITGMAEQLQQATMENAVNGISPQLEAPKQPQPQQA
jgi:hypothetical protein